LEEVVEEGGAVLLFGASILQLGRHLPEPNGILRRWGLPIVAVVVTSATAVTGWLLLDAVAHEAWCFRVQSGPEIIGPGQISEALVGFKVNQEPLGTTALDADDDGQHMRIPVSVLAS
jgi:hypothetical protein